MSSAYTAAGMHYVVRTDDIVCLGKSMPQFFPYTKAMKCIHLVRQAKAMINSLSTRNDKAEIANVAFDLSHPTVSGGYGASTYQLTPNPTDVVTGIAPEVPRACPRADACNSRGSEGSSLGNQAGVEAWCLSEGFTATPLHVSETGSGYPTDGSPDPGLI